MLKEISISFILILSLVSVRAQTHIFVASDGNDQQAGSIEKPLRSLHAAVEKLKSIKKTHANEQVIISLRGGEYAIDQSIRLDQSLSGTADKPTIIAAYGQEKVTLTGGIKIDPTQLADVKEAKWRSRIHPAAKGKVKTVRLEDGQDNLDEGLFPHGFGYDPHSIIPASSMLFIDNQAYELGRWPNAGEPILKIGDILDPGTISRVEKVPNPKGAKFKYLNNFKKWNQTDDLWIYGYFAYGYADDNIKLEKIDHQAKTIQTHHHHIYGFHSSADTSNWGLKHSHKIRGFYVYNVLEEVDQPGEYFYDRQENRLFVYPTADLNSDSDIRMTKFGDPFIYMEGVQHLQLENIGFTYSRGLGIYMGYVSHIRVKGCRFENLGGRAISMGDTYADAGKKELANQNENNFVSIENCYINNMGSGGIYMNGGNNKTLTPGNNQVLNCEISNFNLFNKTYAPGVHVTGVGQSVRHCYIHNAPHMGIYFQGNNLLFEYNKIANVCQNASDMGAIYTGRNQAEQGNTIRYNYFENIYKDEDNRVCAVYLDDGTVGHQVYGNIFYRCGNPTDKGSFGAVHVNGGYNNYFSNNIFVNCKQALGNSPWTEEKWNTDLMGADLQHKLKTRVDITSNAYQDAYPDLHEILDTSRTMMRYNYSDNNIAFLCQNFASGNYVNSNMIFLKDSEKSDPFISYKDKNFNLKDSIRIQEVLPKFKTIPFDRIGLLKP